MIGWRRLRPGFDFRKRIRARSTEGSPCCFIDPPGTSPPGFDLKRATTWWRGAPPFARAGSRQGRAEFRQRHHVEVRPNDSVALAPGPLVESDGLTHTRLGCDRCLRGVARRGEPSGRAPTGRPLSPDGGVTDSRLMMDRDRSRPRRKGRHPRIPGRRRRMNRQEVESQDVLGCFPNPADAGCSSGTIWAAGGLSHAAVEVMGTAGPDWAVRAAARRPGRGEIPESCRGAGDRACPLTFYHGRG